jgi:hypothetical protein
MVKTGKITFEQFIHDDTYYLTTLDLWLLVTRLKLPTIFIANLEILETKYDGKNYNMFIGYQDESRSIEQCIFILLPALNTIEPILRLIHGENDATYIHVDDMLCFDKMDFCKKNNVTITECLERLDVEPKFKSKYEIESSDSEDA